MAKQSRPPVVTILGHVDHGKTTLLDFIRKTQVAIREHGGITQAIGAYQVKAPDGKLITFIDTPGHAAFEKMRSRGAQLADIVVLVIAVDDGIMLQTLEAIKHIKLANIPMVVAVNKIDLPAVNLKAQLEKIKKQLSDNQVLIEEYGGDVPLVQLSAKTGQGIPDLLETLNLVAEVNELKGDPDGALVGIIIESKLDKSKGPVTTVLVRDGTLKKGDQLVALEITGKVRGIFDWEGKMVDQAGPSTPVEVLGFNAVPPVGVRIGETKAVQTETKASSYVGLLDKLKETKDELLNIIIRADKQGSLEAIEDILLKFNQDKQHIRIASSGTGNIVDADVKLASVTQGIIVGFNVEAVASAKKLAETERVLIRMYNVIYELTDEISDVVEGMLKPGKVEEVFGRAQVLAEFPFGKGERIAGCRITDGIISKGPKVRVIRGDEVIGEAKIKSLRKVKEEVGKVEKGMECGILFDTEIDFLPGDVVESFRVI